MSGTDNSLYDISVVPVVPCDTVFKISVALRELSNVKDPSVLHMALWALWTGTEMFKQAVINPKSTVELLFSEKTLSKWIKTCSLMFSKMLSYIR